jgi:hypothetical protein
MSVVESFKQIEHAHVDRGPRLIVARSSRLEPLPLTKKVEPKKHKTDYPRQKKVTLRCEI